MGGRRKRLCTALWQVTPTSRTSSRTPVTWCQMVLDSFRWHLRKLLWHYHLGWLRVVGAVESDFGSAQKIKMCATRLKLLLSDFGASKIGFPYNASNQNCQQWTFASGKIHLLKIDVDDREDYEAVFAGVTPVLHKVEILQDWDAGRRDWTTRYDLDYGHLPVAWFRDAWRQ